MKKIFRSSKISILLRLTELIFLQNPAAVVESAYLWAVKCRGGRRLLLHLIRLYTTLGGGLNYVVNNLNKYQHNVDDFST